MNLFNAIKFATLIVVAMAILFPIIGIAADKQPSYNLLRATECVDDGEYDKAIDYLKKEISANPKDAEVHDILGILYFISEDYGKALESTTNALRYYPKKEKSRRASLHYFRGMSYLKLTDSIAAQQDFETAYSLQPEESNYAIALAEYYFDQNRYSDSDAIYNEMLKKHIGLSDALFGLTRTAIAEGRYDDAKKHIARARLIDPTSPLVDIYEMRIANLTEDYVNMVNKAIDVVANEFDNDEAMDLLLNVPAPALDYAVKSQKKKAFEDKEHSSFWSFVLGNLYQNNKDYKSAIELYDSLRESDDYSDIALEGLSYCYLQVGDLDKAEAAANACLELDEDNEMALMSRGLARVLNLRFEEAKADLQKVVAISPDYGAAYYVTMGMIAELEKDYDHSLKNYEMALALSKDNPEDIKDIELQIGYLYIDHLDRKEEGLEIMRNIVANKSDVSQDNCTLADAYAALGEKEKAIEAIDNVLSLCPNGWGNIYDVACIYSRLQDKDKAFEYLRKAFELDCKMFRIAQIDEDLEYIRKFPEFNALIDEFDKPKETVDVKN